ncbi:MAG: LCP family protein [Clostridia bacterium]|nr:LCP family protein [Clostridia bacterium]
MKENKPSKKSVYKPPKNRDIFSSDVYKTRSKRAKSKIVKTADGGVDLSSMSRRAGKKKRNVKLIVTNVLLSILFAFSTIATVGMSLVDSDLLKKNEIDQKEEGTFEDLVVSTHENVSYFLIVGTDLSQNLTDIIMVACYDLDNNSMNILQIPRDTFIGIDTPTAKVNAVYGNPRKGESKIKALIRCINYKFGLPIDHYVTVTIPGFRKIIDAMGGVEMYLDRKYTVEDSRPMDKGGSAVNITIGPGNVILKGYEAEGFVRHRNSYAKGDMGRVEAQRRFYAALAKKMTSISFSQVTEILTTGINEISTDLTLGQLLGYAEKAHKLDLSQVNIMAVPGQAGTYKPQGGYSRSYYSVHKQQLADMLNDYFRPYEDTVITVDELGIEEIHNREQQNHIEDGGSLDEFIETE